ncbi:predicted protein [Plenodomus lingam JN3]|uniref:Predicted protein n=1 Tax=Leptosphaeria maculans (strain JN3 / isolate v23.1.3 / race Av1-4-5-6-7-8) TaxID=985895 RepID=E5A8F6_LEPMJ|nr:predicted protein [Plenodomus lingam JN3]CBX99901.1 predicted protein [Plenodomus lingam JN3]
MQLGTAPPYATKRNHQPSRKNSLLCHTATNHPTMPPIP